jgi:hypothetical protein
LAFSLPEHADEHSPKDAILLAVDQELGESATLRVAPELSDSVGPLEVGKHQDVEWLGAASRSQGIEPFTELPLDVLQVHEGER